MKATGKTFRANEIRLRVRCRSFVLNPQLFKDKTFEFATASPYDYKVLN